MLLKCMTLASESTPLSLSLLICKMETTMTAVHSCSRIKCMQSTELKPGPQRALGERAVVINGVSATISRHFVPSQRPADCWAQGGSHCISLSLISASLVPTQGLA